MRLRYLSAGIVCLALAGPSWSACNPGDEKALQWLDRMSHSLRETSYRGVFTYQHGNSVQAMRISHSVNGNIESEEVSRLNGDSATVVRTEHPLDCVHPGHKLLRLGSLYAAEGDSCGMADYYQLKMSGVRRVAGRPAAFIKVLPRDMYRYGYLLAIDTETGLLLKTQTVSLDGTVLERFQFAEIRIGEVPLEGTQVDVIHHAEHAHGDDKSRSVSKTAEPWRVSWLPVGFQLTEGAESSHYEKTYTDGLAVFTVFLEDLPELRQPGDGRARQGGTTAYTRGMLVDQQPTLVTVLGEVPVSTARMVADSVQRGVPDAD